MNKKFLNKKYNMTYLGMYLFLSTSIGLNSLNVYGLVRHEEPVVYTTVDNTYVDLHISSMLDEVDYIEEEIVNNEIVLFEDFDDTYDLDSKEYKTEDKIIKADVFQITTDNKTYEYLEDSDFEFFVANVAAESNGNKHDALAVASSILNRCDSEKWVNYLNTIGLDGENPIHHIKAPGQYNVYETGSYLEYMVDVPLEVISACKAAWYDGIRNHNYCSFRSNNAADYSGNQIVEDGNRFNDEIKKNIKK